MNEDEAKHAACKSTSPALLKPYSKNFSLHLYNESYGSKAQMAVMCPHTKYWQNTLSEVVGNLTNELHTDGVYIDQIAAAGPRPCWDPTHEHPLGGGHHWRKGYADMLNNIRQRAGDQKLHSQRAMQSLL